MTDTPCNVFHWLGQTMESCDLCGRPAWDHDYAPTLGAPLPFGDTEDRGVPWSSALVSSWLARRVIDQDRAMALLQVPARVATP